MEVRNTPGTIALTKTPCRDHSTAKDFVRAPTAALLAPYAATSNRARKVDSEAILMMRPYFRLSMCSPKT